ncbi:unnamed protein product [Owenia fusiformis]|uniref:Signal peptidase complex subunit 2 n=1 Tax=Owenia fusiformis TaxID=6347 RepID=A0A8S4NLV4_OWEFU|nr:unnamed protein product [Owenia fusiformis]
MMKHSSVIGLVVAMVVISCARPGIAKLSEATEDLLLRLLTREFAEDDTKYELLGTVKSFQKGYGYITPDDGTSDVLVQYKMTSISDADKPLKVDKWDGVAVKNAMDDSVKKVFTDRYGYVESHTLMDGRLIICTIAVAFAGFALIWDYLNPFPQSRPVLITCVLTYFFMMGVLTLYTTYREKLVFMLALDKDKSGVDPDNVWQISSLMKKYDDMYTLTLEYKDGSGGACRTGSWTKSVSCFIDEDGEILQAKLDPVVRQLHDSLKSEKKEK